jgi:hypothetical protein
MNDKLTEIARKYAADDRNWNTQEVAERTIIRACEQYGEAIIAQLLKALAGMAETAEIRNRALAQAEADKKRLDWLMNEGYWFVKDTVVDRAAIDEAMK